MMIITIPEYSIKIHPFVPDELEAVLEVYRQCEDFLALGPVPTASMKMIRKDLEISQEEGGIFCGIYTSDETMIGILDFVPKGFRGDPCIAFLSLLMIAEPFRKQGIGKAVVQAVETEIRKDPQIAMILSGVQVNNPRAVRFWQRNGYRIMSGPELMLDHTIAFGLRKDLDS
jgi:ribosomal protein S18 acetylase RimI-like enzyme